MHPCLHVTISVMCIINQSRVERLDGLLSGAKGKLKSDLVDFGAAKDRLDVALPVLEVYEVKIEGALLLVKGCSASNERACTLSSLICGEKVIDDLAIGIIISHLTLHRYNF